MYEAILTETAQMLLKERHRKAEQARVVRIALKHRASQKADRARAPRAMCRRSGQAAY